MDHGYLVTVYIFGTVKNYKGDALTALKEYKGELKKINLFKLQKNALVVDAVFGIGPKDATVLGKGVYKNFGIAQTGFNISSCQFAMHYFFKNIVSVNTFVRNLTECTKVNGYYIGTGRNALNAGPVTLGSTMTLDGAWVIV